MVTALVVRSTPSITLCVCRGLGADRAAQKAASASRRRLPACTSHGDDADFAASSCRLITLCTSTMNCRPSSPGRWRCAAASRGRSADEKHRVHPMSSR